MKLFRTLLTLLSVFAVTWTPSSAADTDSHRQAVIKLLELTEMQLKIEASVSNVLALQINQNPALQAHEVLLRDFLEKHIGWKGLKDDIVAMYMQAFSETELDEINSFYGTATGQKLIARLPELIQQRDRLAMQRMQENIGELQQAISNSSKPQ
jgi:hypothetical protein